MRHSKFSAFVVAVFVFLMVQTIHAQVPGYMGKKIHLQGGIKFFPQFGPYPVNMVQPDISGLVVTGMNYRFELGMDFMVSRRISVGFNGHYYSTAANHYIYDPIYASGRIGIDGGAVGAVFKVHFGSWIAPLGSYYRLEAGSLIYSAT